MARAEISPRVRHSLAHPPRLPLHEIHQDGFLLAQYKTHIARTGLY